MNQIFEAWTPRSCSTHNGRSFTSVPILRTRMCTKMTPSAPSMLPWWWVVCGLCSTRWQATTILLGAVVWQGAMSLAQGLSGLTRILAIALLDTIFVSTKAEFYMCLPAVNLVFNYSDDLVLELHNNILLKLYGLNLPIDHVSLQLNDSINDTRPSIIHTGVDDVTLVGQFQQWDGLTELNLWPGDSANDINGTEGLLFRPLLKEGDNLTVFVDDVARSFPLAYHDTISILGLKAFVYELPPEVFQSAATNPDNARWGSWCPDGLIYLGVLQVSGTGWCRLGSTSSVSLPLCKYPPVPVFGSKPHFLDADPELTRDKFDMPGPNRSQDETVMNVQPVRCPLLHVWIFPVHWNWRSVVGVLCWIGYWGHHSIYTAASAKHATQPE